MDVLDLVNDSNHVGPGHDFLVRPFVCKYDHCDRAFARKSDLARHFRIHTNERPFQCMYRGCGKAFIQRSALTVHTRVHTGERPHHCETCNKAFADSSSLARHRRIHTGKRPYGCKVPGCGRQFARRNTYLKHFKRQHPDLPPPTSSSVRALHVPNYRPTGFIPGAPGAISAPGSDSQDYSANSSVSGHPHAFAASHPPEGAAYYGGGFVNGQLHSSQLAAPGGGARLFFHPTDPAGQGAYPGLQHHTPDGSSHQTSPSDRTPGDLQANNNGLAYDQTAQNGQLVSPDYTNGTESVFANQEAVARMNGGNNFMFMKHDPHTLRQYGTPMPMVGAPWVGGGFAPGQLSIPSQLPLQPSYYPNGQPKMENGKMANGRLCQSPLSERAASPDLVDINAVPTIKFQQPPNGYGNMQFSVDSHGSMVSPLTTASMMPGTQGQLHAVPSHMQRFHSAPGMPMNHSWSNPDPFKCSTPGFEQRPPQQQPPSVQPRRSEDANSIQWDENADGQAMSRENSANGTDDASSSKDANEPAQQSKVEWGQAPSYPNVSGVLPRGSIRMSSAASTASTTSSLMNVTQTPQGLPPISIFPLGGQAGQFNNLSFSMGHQWQQPLQKPEAMTPTVIGKPLFGNPHMEEQLDDQTITLGSPVQHKDPSQRDRQVSGVSAVGLGIANVTFDESGLEVEGEHWAPSDIGTDGEDELESEEDDEDNDSDDDFMPGANGKKRRRHYHWCQAWPWPLRSRSASYEAEAHLCLRQRPSCCERHGARHTCTIISKTNGSTAIPVSHPYHIKTAFPHRRSGSQGGE